jgi:hypothetical protein
MTAHALTLARCAPRLVLAKTWHADGSCDGYDLARHVDLATVEARDLDALHRLLVKLLDKPRVCVLRGEIADPDRARGVRRLVHPDSKTGDAPTLRDVPRAWLALDLDGVPLPAEVDPRDLNPCADIALATLPAAFRRVAHIAQATASHGIKPGARLRLWFLLSRPTSGAELGRWLRGVRVDESVFSAAQPIYSARPIFVGRPDPLPARLVLRAGADVVEVPPPAALAPPPRPAVAPPRPRSADDGGRALARAATNIATAAEGDRHWTAVRAARWLGCLARDGVVHDGEVIAVVERALHAAGKPAGEGRAIAEHSLAWARGVA